MSEKRILVCSTDKDLQARIRAALACAGRDVLAVETQLEAINLLETGSIELAVVDVMGFVGALGLLDLAHGRLPSIAVAPGDDLHVLNSLICEIGVTNVVARPTSDSDDDLSEFYITAEKILREDLFGLEKYLSGATSDLHELTLRNAGDRDSAIAEISAYLKQKRCGRHVLRAIENAADEMMTNAVYNAPIKVDGSARYAATNRRVKIDLMPEEHVRVQYGTCDGLFGLSVRDNFGRLSLGHLRRSIERCSTKDDPIEQKEGGAGLGLFLVARTARQFVVNVDPGRCTEVIALWSIGGPRHSQVRSQHSLHYFEAAMPLDDAGSVVRAKGTISPASGQPPGLS